MNWNSRIGLGCSFALVLIACGGSGGSTVDAGADAPPACATTGTGTLVINVTGLPASSKANVGVTGPNGKLITVDATQTITPADAGNFVVKAPRYIQPDPLVRTVYEATVSTSTACVSNGQTTTVNVTYAPIPTSNKLWALNGNGGNGSMLGFASALLTQSGAPPATVTASGPGGGSVAFDKDGNLWAIGPTTGDASLVRYPASAFSSSGAKTPDRTITIKDLGCLPGPNSLAFDAGGDLWMSVPCGKNVLRIPNAQLAATGNATPSVKLAGFTNPTGLAFDTAGNLWVGDETLERFAKASLDSSASTPNAKFTLKSPVVAGGNNITADQLAFDGSGNLWVSDFAGDSISKVASSDLAGTGVSTVNIATQVNVGVGALVDGMALDEGGGMWLTFSAGKIARINATQLGVTTTGGAPTAPDVVISSADIGYAGALAFYPAATGTPLFASRP